jgi:type IV pilus assembly protein PilX
MRNTKLHRQRGAALVIGLILLVVITLLAVVGMNISNTELAGATSDQLRLRAFNAAETGLETRLQTLRTDAKTDATPEVRALAAVENSPKSGSTPTDNYTTTTTYRGEGKMISRYSAGTFAGFHFSIASTGTSARKSEAVHTAGAYIVNGVGENSTFGEDKGTPPIVALPTP